MTLKFVVVVPNYNCEEYIEKALESIILQKGDFKIEIVVMDGQSTDHSLNVVQKIQKRLVNKNLKINCRDVKLRVYSEKDEGQTDAINKGIAKARGEIFSYLNSDDEYIPGAFETVSQEYLKNQKTWYIGRSIIISDSGQEIRKNLTKYKNIFLKFANSTTILLENPISQPSTFWSKEHIKKIGLFNKKLYYCMDYEYHIRSFGINKPILIKKNISKMRYIKTRKSADYKGHTLEHHEVTRKFTKNILILSLDQLNLVKKRVIFKLWDLLEKNEE